MVSDGATDEITEPIPLPVPSRRSSSSRWRLTSSGVARSLVRRQKCTVSLPRKRPTTVSLLPTSTASSPAGGRRRPRRRNGSLPLSDMLHLPGRAGGFALAARDEERESDADEVE